MPGFCFIHFSRIVSTLLADEPFACKPWHITRAVAIACKTSILLLHAGEIMLQG